MTEVWTHATFTIRTGREDEFAQVWTSLARRAREEFGASPTLLRDRGRSNVFLGFGPWPDVDTMQRFRSATNDVSAPLDELVEDAETSLCDKVFP
jgi:hypothetical protein